MPPEPRPVRIAYDPEARAAYIELSGPAIRPAVRHTIWVGGDWIALDTGQDGEPVGIELLGVARPVVEELRRGD